MHRFHYNGWTASIIRLRQLEDMLDDYAMARNEDTATQHLRVWRMRLFQLRGPAMQADLFNKRSQHLKLRLLLRIWREKERARKTSSTDLTIPMTTEASDRAHTAPITPNRSTRRYLWRHLNSR
jgi:Sfi1 spindle body protein